MQGMWSIAALRSGARAPALALLLGPWLGCVHNRSVSQTRQPGEVLALMERVADWQLAHPAKYDPATWTQCAGYTGIMALAAISSKPRFHEAMLRMGEKNGWQLGTEGNPYHADDHCVGQVYAELYLQHRDSMMIAPMRA